MAKIIREGKEVSVPDNSNIAKPSEELGVPFSCESGDCGCCLIEVEKGMENLSPRNEKEDNFAFQDNMRLACQCTIKSGEVEFK